MPKVHRTMVLFVAWSRGVYVCVCVCVVVVCGAKAKASWLFVQATVHYFVCAGWSLCMLCEWLAKPADTHSANNAQRHEGCSTARGVVQPRERMQAEQHRLRLSFCRLGAHTHTQDPTHALGVLADQIRNMWRRGGVGPNRTAKRQREKEAP